MKLQGSRIENAIKRSILAAIFLIIYVGPASLLAIEQIFDSETFGDTSAGEAFLWIAFIWMFAIPLIVALRKWNRNPAISVTGLGVFLGASLSIWLMFRNLGAALLSVALSAPFAELKGEDVWTNGFFYTACVLSFVTCIVIPGLGIAFQRNRKAQWDRVQKEYSASSFHHDELSNDFESRTEN